MDKGLYIHIPFCRSKCPYCDFYSVRGDEKLKNDYTDVILHLLKNTGSVFDTVYFGGGTPSQLGAENLCRILDGANFRNGAEVTVECNPSDCCDGSFDFSLLARHGVNRISMGLQSADDTERRALGRRAGKNDVLSSIDFIRKAGIDNFSLDLMIATPGQTVDSLLESAHFCIESGAKHISTYILKIEEGTPFSRMRDKMTLPDEDETADMYLALCRYLEEAGYNHYEISNFALDGFESRHNLIYWRSGEYLGLGPAAHSFIGGKRFFYERNLSAFMDKPEIKDDGNGGDFEEYLMLALRLREGLIFENVRKRFGFFPEDVIEKAKKRVPANLINITDESISLTDEGMLLSNSIITEVL